MSESHQGKIRIAIVGAGIMGRTLAWQLLNQAKSVAITVFDKDPISHGGAAAYTAAGMLSPYSELESTELSIFNMGLASLTRWPSVIASLSKQTHRQVDLFSIGTVVVSHQQDQVDFQRFQQQVAMKLPDYIHDDMGRHMQLLNQSALGQLAPQLAKRFDYGVYLPNEAWLDNGQVMATFGEYLLNAGVDWQENSHVSHIENCVQQDQSFGATVCVASAKQTFDYVIDCRGIGAKQDMQGLRGVRGEVITLHAPQVTLKHAVRLIHPRYKLYIAPRRDNHFVIGASQIESEDDGPISVRSALELLSAAYSIDPGFGDAQIVKLAANCRPAFSDNLPRISCKQRVIHINGLFRHGYLLAPIIAEQACKRLFQIDFKSPFTNLIEEVAC
ncbi:glycine oxidase ThiO [Paraglaciecola sp. 20A4]|uniref:glycine oxidase ThiO n=1 Tax=Paraglaciecola sp. 20A4 TaxID=2687288 RepID=UPI001407CDAD